MGPTIFVHLPRPLLDEDMEAIDVWLRDRTISLQRTGIGWEFHFALDSCTCMLAAVPFGAESRGDGTATEVYMTAEERYEYQIALLWLPVTSLQLDNCCRSDKPGHRLLAQCAAHFAREFGGVVEVGAVPSHLIASGRRYEMNEPGAAEYLLVDADFLEEWARHPDFFLPI